MEQVDVVLVCLSERAVMKTGYVQREMKFALDRAEEQPEGTIFIIPVRLDDCKLPRRLSQWQRVDLFADRAFERLHAALAARARNLGRAQLQRAEAAARPRPFLELPSHWRIQHDDPLIIEVLEALTEEQRRIDAAQLEGVAPEDLLGKLGVELYTPESSGIGLAVQELITSGLVKESTHGWLTLTRKGREATKSIGDDGPPAPDS